MLTLIEKSKLCTDPLRKGVIEIFARNSPVLELMPFIGVSSDSYKFNREQTMPRSDFRGINEDYDEGTGNLNPVTESLTILGGVSDVDRALIKTQGNINNIRSVHDSMKVKSASLKFTCKFIKGNTVTDPREFDGLQSRCTGDQLLNVSASGASLTLDALDELIDTVQGGPDVIFCNKTARRKISSLVRASGAAVETVTDAFGRQLTGYAGVPIRVLDKDEAGNEILDFDEASSDGLNSDCTSIYAVRFDPADGVCGLECGDLDVQDLGLYSGGIKLRTLVEWIVGFTVFDLRTAVRLRGVRNT